MRYLPVTPIKLLVIALVVFVSISSIPALAEQYVHGYYRSNGTYVHSYYRTSPDHTVTNNYSYKGNLNPHTGAVGTNYYVHDRTSPYYRGPDSHGRVGHANTPVVVPRRGQPGEVPLCVVSPDGSGCR
jgi:hypothetical protein